MLEPPMSKPPMIKPPMTEPPLAFIPSVGMPAPLCAIALRLTPQQDLRLELDAVVRAYHLTAACVLTCVGSLTQAHLRLANQDTGTRFPRPLAEGTFEIVSLTGVMSLAGSHYHLAIADSSGTVIGGHVLPGCLVYTTAELVLGVMPTLHFGRDHCPQSGYPELSITPHQPNP